MKTRNNRSRVLSVILMMAMLLTMISGVAASADDVLIDDQKLGSITVTKYANLNSSAQTGTATGMAGDKPTGTTPDSGYNTLAGAKFVLVRILNTTQTMAYYNGTEDEFVLDTAELGAVSVEGEAASWNADYNGSTINNPSQDPQIFVGETNASGVYTFADLPVGVYILREITAPDMITNPLAEDSLISIPMVNTEDSENNGNAKWMYDINVYPKNHESVGSLELTKTDENGTALKDVEFELQKRPFNAAGGFDDGSEFTPVTATVDKTGTSTNLTLKTDATGKIVLNNLPAGLYGTQYMLVEVSAPDGYILNPKPIYFMVNADNTMTWNTDTDANGLTNANSNVVEHDTVEGPKVTVKVKNERPSLSKEVLRNGKTPETAAADDWVNDDQFRLDDTLYYKLTVFIPSNVAEMGAFSIVDTPVGITDGEVYSVKVGNAEVDADDYTASVSDDGGFTFELTDAGKADTAILGKTIEIIYEAGMNSSAAIEGDGNSNIATLTYSSKIGAADEYTVEDEARAYTYQFKLTKYKDKVGDGNKLTGEETVTFELRDAQTGDALPMVFVLEGVYRLALRTDTTTVTSMVTKKGDSNLVIQGLENGTYYLKEIKTIKGYNLLSGMLEIYVNKTEVTAWEVNTGYAEDGRVVREFISATITPVEGDNTNTVEIVNKKGFVLPQTGSMGYLLFCVAGLVLIGGGAVLIFGGRKKTIR